MARGPRYRVKFRRRREGKTNYRKRLGLIKSGKPRVVVRLTNKHVIVQFAEAKIEGDHILASATSRELIRDYGWKGDENCTPAAYLVGLLAGLKALKAGIKEGIADIGLHSRKSSRIFAAIKGVKDAGIEIPMGEEVEPDPERLAGKHIENYARLLKNTNEEKFRRQFSRYIKRGLDPENLSMHFEDIKKSIIMKFQSQI